MPKAAYIQEIEDAMKAARGRANKYRERFWGHGKERQTRYWLIDPILRSLGWNVDNPDEVWVEYPVTDGEHYYYIDYAFFRPNEKAIPKMVVEAKSFEGLDAKGYAQLERYAGVLKTGGYAVITTGTFWDIYEIVKKGREFIIMETGRFNIMENGNYVNILRKLHRTRGDW